jgi:hypothetical protein
MGRAAYRRQERELKKSRMKDHLYPQPNDVMLSPYMAYRSQNKIYDDAWAYAIKNYCPMLTMLFGIEMRKRRISPKRIVEIMTAVNDRVRQIGKDLDAEPELTNEGVRQRLHKELDDLTGIDWSMY